MGRVPCCSMWKIVQREEPWRSTGSSSEELESMVQGECEIRKGNLLSHSKGQSPRGSSIVTDQTH